MCFFLHTHSVCVIQVYEMGLCATKALLWSPNLAAGINMRYYDYIVDDAICHMNIHT